MDQVNLLPKNLALENIVFRYQEIRSCSLSRAAQLVSLRPASCSPHSPAPSTLLDDSSRDLDLVFDDSLEEKHSCGLCEEPRRNEAEWFCPQCQVLYCQMCLDTFHPRRGSLIKHKVQRPTGMDCPSNPLFCHDHPGEVASIFCDTCKVVACHLCVCIGQGSHCSHTILDMDTAKKQLQETVQMAQDKLTALVTSFSEKEGTISTHLQNLKVMEDSARSSITSQYNCIMSDIAATLDLARKKSLNAITEFSSRHSSYLLSRGQRVKALLSRCDDLSEACKGFLTTDNDFPGDQAANTSFRSCNTSFRKENIESSSPLYEEAVLSIRKSPQASAQSSSHSRDGDTLTHRHSRDGTVSSEENTGGANSSPCKDTREDKNDAGRKSSDGNCHTDASKVKSSDGKTVPKKSPRSIFMMGKSEPILGASAADATDGGANVKMKNSQPRKVFSEFGKSSNVKQTMRSQSEIKSEQSWALEEESQDSKNATQTDRSRHSKGNNYPQPSSWSVSEGSEEPISSCVAVVQVTPRDTVRKNASVKKTSSKQLFTSQSVDEKVHASDSDADRTQTARTQSLSACGGGEALFDASSQPSAGTVQPTSQLLLRADEVGPVLEQVFALSKQVHSEQSNTEDNTEASTKDHEENISTCISKFRTSTLHLIHNMTEKILDDCPMIIPSVRSVSIASPHQESCIPRVQSRILMTWGFNSTTFTADTITTSAQWTVNVNRNTSHIGDVKSGYLFGVGVALKPLTSKEQVGMTAESHAIVCINGNLALSHDKQISPIMPLSDLPLSVTISVGCGPKWGLFMTYKIRVSGLTRSLQGRRVLILGPGNELDLDQGDASRTKSSDMTSRCEVACSSSQQGSDKSDDGKFHQVGTEASTDSIRSATGGKVVTCDDGGRDSASPVKNFPSHDALSSFPFSVHPVFTVSQRVKMQFPHSSDV
ncbi:E3 ubiquitin protein ligase trim9 [Plakobranchus ocellatus]|uniref:E3 ubiquitin protein ligase trim9 n=1 Tax=Plakobranchus ocellatus TaxID=259542 RepID=A0AAV3ZJ17_9GAST|nr:E3 ubiquitin protein ligase trim9 [Plakobranchus ocellatus]